MTFEFFHLQFITLMYMCDELIFKEKFTEADTFGKVVEEKERQKFPLTTFYRNKS